MNEEIKQVAKDIGITLTDAQINWIVTHYNIFSKQNPYGNRIENIKMAINDVIYIDNQL
jgi:hypothetical protein